MYQAGDYEVAVIGAGHAGIEAALAAAGIGCETVCFTMNLDWIGNLACNPSIGGSSKGHLVREIDALGGEMAKAADKNLIQTRILNRGKGPAIHSLRAQVDRRRYSEYMKRRLENEKKVSLRQAEIICIKKEKERFKITTKLNTEYFTKTAIIATGTFLRGRIYIGETVFDSGPDGMFPSIPLASAIEEMGIKLRRFKTGTPARINRNSADFSGLSEQRGDEEPLPFSFETDFELDNSAVCYITYTNEKTKEIILKNLHRSPLYKGKIEGIGARYCPSIEDKIVRFAEKERHQVFIEPCGKDTEELYLQGLSSSLPEEVQKEIICSIKGLEKSDIMRPAYAIEYDCIDPLELNPTLEFKKIPGLFGAGQFNGSSGYEEAAAQGLVAGINAARAVKKLPPMIFERSGSYIGTLIDDLVTIGCNEPYRMMTSRSEYRLILRQDNADLRLSEKGFEAGLINDEKHEKLKNKQKKINEEKKRAERVTISPSKELNDMFVSRETSPISKGAALSELLKRPQLNYKVLAPFDSTRPDLPDEIFEQAETEIKYEGYIKRQKAQIAEMKRLENRVLPDNIDYNKIINLRIEAREKLSKIKPLSLGQAARISGVNPADISVLMIYLEKNK
ncbi:MAG: tRNA uridine-5-carboxymethylaminomethyl(34) synthesis enzyme MnmG [Oscillospiraceae bacterium]|nr:tRNA uridine-5-carboxymethylaminomethyl(34) synthesis enzyme MnmG [Oscillospiraceae bacterium]